MTGKIVGIVMMVAVVAAGCGGGEPAAPLDANRGNQAFEQRDFETAFVLLLPVAETGDADAQFKVGFMYVHGRGVEREVVLRPPVPLQRSKAIPLDGFVLVARYTFAKVVQDAEDKL